MPRIRTKGKIILDMLAKSALSTADIIVNISLEPLRHSYKGVPALMRGKNVSTRSLYEAYKINNAERQKFYFLLANLKRDGLITRADGSSDRWKLTEMGKMSLKGRGEKGTPIYHKKPTNDILVISYDIPRNHNSDRNWLRSNLKLLDFQLIHQSTWIGKNEIPEELLHELRRRKIFECVHVFTIGKRGSIKRTL